MAAQLRAERIQRATLARQKQLQRLVRGTRGGKKLTETACGEDFERKVILFIQIQLKKEGDPLNLRDQLSHRICIFSSFCFEQKKVAFLKKMSLVIFDFIRLLTHRSHQFKMAIGMSNVFAFQIISK